MDEMEVDAEMTMQFAWLLPMQQSSISRRSATTANGCKKVSFLPMAGVSESGFIASSEERDISEVSQGYTVISRKAMFS